MSSSLQAVRFATRQLRKSPGFTITAVLTLALGIGATTAVFSLVEGILLRPLPFHRPDRLVMLGDHLGNGPHTPVTAREIGTYSTATRAFSSMGGYMETAFELSGGATPEQVNAARFTAGVFPTLRVNPVLGRVFTKQEEDAKEPLAVISYGLWVNRFQRDPRVLGSSMTLDRRSYTIIGVMPRNFEFPLQPGRLDQAQLWVPMSLSADELSEDNRGSWGYHMVARMRDGITVAQAASDAERVAQQIMLGFPASMSAIHIRGDAIPLREYFVSDSRPILRALLYAVLVVLLIACLNVAGLLLVRAIRQRREYAVRLALGARPGAILRESMSEGLLLSLSGGILGLALAFVLVRTALHLLPESMPRIDSISVDSRVALFALALAILCGVGCSFAPAFAVFRTNLSESLKEGERTNTGAASHSWLRSAIVVSEIAIALVLITTSLAFLRSFQRMRATDPGFQPDHVVIAAYQLPITQYSTHEAVEVFEREISERLSHKPGVIAAGIGSTLPATNSFPGAAYTIEGLDESKWKLKFSMFSLTYGNYFQAMNIPLLAGRYFTDEDRADQPLVVIVGQSMAKHSWPGQQAIGKRMHVGNPHKGYPWATVVGVVADTTIGSRDEPREEQWYMPAEQPAIIYGYTSNGNLMRPESGYIAVRGTLPPAEMESTLRSTVSEIDPLLALQQVQSMNDVITDVEAPRRFNTDLIIAFGTTALLLALIGIYAVVAFSASLRNHEMAIRLALGAQSRHITTLVVTSGLKMTMLGCALGVLGSVAVSRLVRSLLFQVSATDPLIYAAGVILMLSLALLASTVPARRAAAADPVEALRSS